MSADYDAGGDADQASGVGFDLDADGRAQAWRILALVAEEHLSSVRHIGITPTKVTPTEIRERLRAYDFATPLDLPEVVEDVMVMLRDWTLHTSSPTHFGLFNPAAAFAGVVGETLAAVINPQLAVWSHAPAARQTHSVSPMCTVRSSTGSGRKAPRTPDQLDAYRAPGGRFSRRSTFARRDQPMPDISRNINGRRSRLIENQ